MYSKNITDVVGIEITLRVNVTSSTADLDIRCMRTVIVMHVSMLLESKTGLDDFEVEDMVFFRGLEIDPS